GGVEGSSVGGPVGGEMARASLTGERVAEQVGWVREAAGGRFGALELRVLAQHAFVVDDRARGARLVAERLAGLPRAAVEPAELSPAPLLDAPPGPVATAGQIAD